jgi:predicted enzyme related to lactoylglutathione lyase
MIDNRSIPTKAILPHVHYSDVPRAIAWLSENFGFIEHYRYGNPVSGAQLHLGDAWIMLKLAPPANATPRTLGYGTQSLTIFVDSVEEHFNHAKAAGAKIVEELQETIYGELQYGVEDHEGHHWLFSKHARDLSPEEWGATVAETVIGEEPHRPRPSFCYLQIPAVDVAESLRFYEAVFGWNIRRRDSPSPSFDDASGNISGAWVAGREIHRQPGLLPYIWVDDLRATVAAVSAHDGEIVEAPHSDHPGGTSWIATFRDPAGNVLGLYQENVQI